MEVKDTFFSKKQSLNIRGRLIYPDYPLVMGIINITPDSFYEKSRIMEEEALISRVKAILAEGGSMIDIGAYSSRPGAEEVSQEEEIKRLSWALPIIRNNFPETILSIDTFRAEVARIAVQSFEADIINDISGGSLDEKMFETMATLKVPYILMHMRGNPQTMPTQNHYQDLIGEIMKYFGEKVQELSRLGVGDIILDPGFGFAKDVSQNFELLASLDQFRILQLPMLVGLSRKSFIYKTLNITAAESLEGTVAMNTVALLKGADILRVHDVKAASDCIRLVKALGN